ncbi:MAG: gluconokinase [Bdellovibrionales bacterium]|nr:gluconokinase [Bdellovibrionales bacterium]
MVIVLMGVTGCGKTTVGKILAQELNWHFYDADDFHPEENVEKMRKGIPLNDEDRLPWLEALRNLINQAHQEEFNAILACSALKENYREMLSHELKPVKFIYLRGPEELIQDRLNARQGHYMNPKLLPSQFAALEEPSPDKAIHIDIAPSPQQIADSIRSELGM